MKEAFTVAQPKLWWPNGMGQPNLYRVRLTLLRNGMAEDALEFDYGIRTIRTVPSAGPRTADRWANWQFVVNGRPLFVKGINWMPADILLDLPRDRYDWLLAVARVPASRCCGFGAAACWRPKISTRRATSWG